MMKKVLNNDLTLNNQKSNENFINFHTSLAHSNILCIRPQYFSMKKARSHHKRSISATF
jgi:hypothetical protein